MLGARFRPAALSGSGAEEGVSSAWSGLRTDLHYRRLGDDGAGRGGGRAQLALLCLLALGSLSAAGSLLLAGGLSSTMLVLYALLATAVGAAVWHRRRVQVFWVAFQIRGDYKASRAAARALDNPTAEELQSMWAPVHDRSAERMQNMVTTMAGLWVKTAQLLATRSDIMPDPVRISQPAAQCCQRWQHAASATQPAQRRWPTDRQIDVLRSTSGDSRPRRTPCLRSPSPPSKQSLLPSSVTMAMPLPAQRRTPPRWQRPSSG